MMSSPQTDRTFDTTVEARQGCLPVGNRLDLNPNNRIPVLVELLCYASRLDSGAIGLETDWVHHLWFF
jgi:hypothetical protein